MSVTIRSCLQLMKTNDNNHHMLNRHGFIPQKSFNPSTKTFKPLSVSNIAVGVSETFVRLKKQGKAAFIPFLTAGDPDLSTTAEALKILDRSGAAMIELGVPCSSPFADGPVIQASCARALANGTNLDSILAMAKTVTPELSCPVILFSYYKMVLNYGVYNFMSTVKDAGIRGLVIPDLPIEDTYYISNEAVRNNIQLVLLTTPTTSMEQMQAIVRATTGFVYLVSSIGVTGERKTVNTQVEFLLKEIKRVTDKPVAVGFGLSKPEHVQQVVQWGADGAIVGSALVRLMADAKSPEQGLRELESFSKNLTSALAV